MGKFKKNLKKFFLIDDSPHKVAAGAALGIFMGIAPGEGVMTTLFFSWIFRFNRLAALAGVATTNMWTSFFLLPVSATIGGFLFHKNIPALIQQFPQQYSLDYKYFFSKIIFFDLIIPVAVGLTIVAVVISLVCYFVLYFALKHKKIKFR